MLVVLQPDDDHNGGDIHFGPDGYLYVALGDGGDGGCRSQIGTNLLGKILRLDVSAPTYAIPADNPFVGVGAVRDEIWHLGLQNPWRFSFDRLTGDLYVADVGQNEWEEVNVAPASAGRGRGLNFGWDVMEATSCFEPPVACDMTGLPLPAVE